MQMQPQQMPQPLMQEQKKSSISSFLGGLFGSISSKKPEPAKESKATFYEQERNLSCNEVDSDDLDGDLNLSDSEDGQ